MAHIWFISCYGGIISKQNRCRDRVNIKGEVINIEKKEEQVKNRALRNSILIFNPVRTFPLVFGDFIIIHSFVFVTYEVDHLMIFQLFKSQEEKYVKKENNSLFTMYQNFIFYSNQRMQ
jgi:hypothetical protein